jgi:hypothetical protein
MAPLHIGTINAPWFHLSHERNASEIGWFMSGNTHIAADVEGSGRSATTQ